MGGPLEDLLAKIRAAGHTAEHDLADLTTGWVLKVDGEVVATGYSTGDLIREGERWWRAQRSPS